MFAVNRWAEFFSSRHTRLKRFLEETYGRDPSLLEQKRQQYLTALEHYSQRYDAGDDVFIVRSPGRINLMGRHIDHRGGDVNVIAISDECIAVVSPREDDIVEFSNAKPDRFARNQFAIGAVTRDLQLQDWFTCVNSPKTIALVNDGDWENYIKAAVLRLQNRFASHRLSGMKMTVHGSIPMGSGLSSSSALVVATAEACIRINGLPVKSLELVDLCGEAEWFVGTRGGSGDHGAISLGRCGEVANMSFFPLRVKSYIPFPDDHRIVIVNSGIDANKMAGARAEFNGRVLAYVIGEALFKLTFPHLADRIEHLRDINPKDLDVTLGDLYEMLLQIPEEVAYAQIPELRKRLPKADNARLDDLMATGRGYDEPLRVRNILLYGIAEIRRSQLYSHYMRRNDIPGMRRLFNASHNGDRVATYDESLNCLPWDYQVTEQYLRGLISGLQSDDPLVRESCQLEWQPGRYECSVPSIDRIVDMAYRMEGVLGAQMAGAGLGGCVMVIVREECHTKVMDRYAQAGLDVHLYSPVKGADVVALS